MLPVTYWSAEPTQSVFCQQIFFSPALFWISFPFFIPIFFFIFLFTHIFLFFFFPILFSALLTQKQAVAFYKRMNAAVHFSSSFHESFFRRGINHRRLTWFPFWLWRVWSISFRIFSIPVRSGSSVVTTLIGAWISIILIMNNTGLYEGYWGPRGLISSGLIEIDVFGVVVGGQDVGRFVMANLTQVARWPLWKPPLIESSAPHAPFPVSTPPPAIRASRSTGTLYYPYGAYHAFPLN